MSSKLHSAAKRKRVQVSFKDVKSLTKQAMKDDADINRIVKRHMAQKIPFPTDTQAVYGDFSALPSLQDAYAFVERANEAFAKLPSSVRETFGNSPRAFVEAIETDPNAVQYVYDELGLKPKGSPPPASQAPKAPQEEPEAPVPSKKAKSPSGESA